MAIEAIQGKVRSEPLNRNFSYLDSGIKNNEEAVGNLEDTVDKNLDQIYDLTLFPQSPIPPKTGAQSKSFKIIHKRTADTLYVTQKTNKGYVQYRLERNTGASQEGRDYGENHELLRLVRARYMPHAYVYAYAGSPYSGTVETFREPSGMNDVEKLIFSETHVNTANNHHSGREGIGAYRFASGTSVSYRVPAVAGNKKMNILFYCTSGSSNDVGIYINNELVYEFSPQDSVTTNGSSTVRVIEFDIPSSALGSNIEIRIENNAASGWTYICALNFFRLEDYEGQYITDYKAFGSTKSGWIESSGANDYAIRDANGLLFGSYHGGEISESDQIYFNHANHYPVSEYDFANLPLDNIDSGDWSLQREFNIYQRTSLANNQAKMISRFNFDIDGTMLMDFAYSSDNSFPITSFRTALTGTNVLFRHLTYPIYNIFPEIPTNEYFEFPITEGRISQVSSSELLQLDIRFTRFNKEHAERGAYVADNAAYRKFYYGPLDGTKELPLKALTFSKGLDFIVR